MIVLLVEHLYRWLIKGLSFRVLPASNNFDDDGLRTQSGRSAANPADCLRHNLIEMLAIMLRLPLADFFLTIKYTVLRVLPPHLGGTVGSTFNHLGFCSFLQLPSRKIHPTSVVKLRPEGFEKFESRLLILLLGHRESSSGW